MPIWLQYLLVCTVPAALIMLLTGVPKLVSRWFRREPEPHPSGPPIERLVADLRRLSNEQDSVRAGDRAARHGRLVAIGLAYDDVLLQCCDALELTHPGPPPLTRQQRHAIEAELLRSGLRW